MARPPKAQPADVLVALQAAVLKGALLEEVASGLLRDLGFDGIRRQRSGSQYGFDLSATRQGPDGPERWVFECKNLSGDVTMNDLAPKLIWHDGGTLDAFVLISVTDVSNDVLHFLEQHSLPMEIQVWSGEALARMVAGSARALARLGLSSRPWTGPAPQRLRFPSSGPVSLDVVHHDHPPGSFHYVVLDDASVAKSYVHDGRFVLDLFLGRRVAGSVVVRSIDVIPTRHHVPSGRVLWLLKPKGLFEPHRVEFSLSPTLARTPLLGSTWLSLDSPQDGCLQAILQAVEAPGLYEFHIEALAGSASGATACRSATFLLHEPAPDANLLKLVVRGRHFDTGAQAVLDLPDTQWDLLRRESQREDSALFLGPTGYEIQQGVRDETWLIRRQRLIATEHGMAARDNDPSEVFMRLGGHVDEQRYTLSTALSRARGTHPSFTLLERQLERRGFRR